MDRSRRTESCLGFFAALYRKVTIAVKEGIASGRFEDGQRMERLDVIFANRYIDAYEGFQRDNEVMGCWLAAFQSAHRHRAIILQHLLLGMNAHINLDLGIAAAQTCQVEDLPSLRRDFNEINVVLSELVVGIQERIAEVSPWLGFLDHVGGRTDEVILEFSMERARDAAWSFATRLVALSEEQQVIEIAGHDKFVAALAHRLLNPRSLIVKMVLPFIRSRESKNVSEIIGVLAS